MKGERESRCSLVESCGGEERRGDKVWGSEVERMGGRTLVTFLQ